MVSGDNVRGRAMETEIREQPRVLAENADRYLAELRQAVGSGSFDMVLLAARGSSDNAALFGRYLIEIHLGIPVVLAAPSVLTRFGTRVRYPKCLAVGVSQSGAAPDVSEVLAALRADGHTTLALTNTPGSRLTQEAEHGLVFGVGTEHAVAATKTYTASLLALYQLVRALGAELPAPQLPDAGWVDRCFAEAERALPAALMASTLFALARGYGFCTAQETALKLIECALLPCKSYSTADFAHGPRALAIHGSTAVVFGEVPDGLEASGCRIVSAPSAGEAPSAPISEILFSQALALLAARGRGLDPDKPAHLSKVTETL